VTQRRLSQNTQAALRSALLCSTLSPKSLSFTFSHCNLREAAFSAASCATHIAADVTQDRKQSAAKQKQTHGRSPRYLLLVERTCSSKGASACEFFMHLARHQSAERRVSAPTAANHHHTVAFDSLSNFPREKLSGNFICVHIREQFCIVEDNIRSLTLSLAQRAKFNLCSKLQ
jgi:hypothetical protein